MKPKNFKPLSCKDGCCKERMTFLFEKEFAVQDEMITNSINETIILGDFLVDEVIPYLEFQMSHGDMKADELMGEIHLLLAGRT